MTWLESGVMTARGMRQKGMGRSTSTVTAAAASRPVASGRSVTVTSSSNRWSRPSCEATPQARWVRAEGGVQRGGFNLTIHPTPTDTLERAGGGNIG
jgi:hypothetical protein